MAETYHIYDYRAMPVKLLATLVSGLGQDSRTYKSITKMPTENTLLISLLIDQIAVLNYRLFGGKNPPKSIYKMLIGEDTEEAEDGYSTAEDFEKMWAKLGGGKHG